jgi:hypothetical protein
MVDMPPLRESDWFLALDIHDGIAFLGPQSMPPPAGKGPQEAKIWPHIVGAKLCWVTDNGPLPFTGFPSKNVFINDKKAINVGHDIGFFIPHIWIPMVNGKMDGTLNLLVPLSILLSSCTAFMGCGSVLVNDKPVGIGPIPIMTCDDPIPLPLGGFVNCTGNVKCGVSLSDIIAALIQYLIAVAIAVIMAVVMHFGGKAFKKFKVGDKLKNGLRKIFKIGGDEVAEKAAEKVAKEAAEEIAEEIGEKVAKEVGEEVAEEVGEKVAREVGEEVAEEVGEKVAREVGEEVAEEVAEEAVEEVAEEAVQKSFKQKVKDGFSDAWEGIKKPFKWANKKIRGELAEETTEEAFERTGKELGEAAAESAEAQVAKEAAEESMEAAQKEAAEHAQKEVLARTQKEVAEEALDEASEKASREALAEASAQEASDAASKANGEAVEELADLQKQRDACKFYQKGKKAELDAAIEKQTTLINETAEEVREAATREAEAKAAKEAAQKAGHEAEEQVAEAAAREAEERAAKEAADEAAEKAGQEASDATSRKAAAEAAEESARDQYANASQKINQEMREYAEEYTWERTFRGGKRYMAQSLDERSWKSLAKGIGKAYALKSIKIPFKGALKLYSCISRQHKLQSGETIGPGFMYELASGIAAWMMANPDKAGSETVAALGQMVFGDVAGGENSDRKDGDADLEGSGLLDADFVPLLRRGMIEVFGEDGAELLDEVEKTPEYREYLKAALEGPARELADRLLKLQLQGIQAFKNDLCSLGVPVPLHQYVDFSRAQESILAGAPAEDSSVQVV